MDDFFYSIADLPLDEWDGKDEDNSVLKSLDAELAKPRILASADEEKLVASLLSQPLLASAKSLNYVPFKRAVRLNTHGKDCFAIKRALSVAGFGKWGGWGIETLFGPFAVMNLKAFQHKNRLKVDGVYGLNTHKKLAPHFDAYGRWLLGQVNLISPSQRKRNIIESTAMLGYAHRYAIHYTQSSLRMQGVRNHIMPPHYPIWEDCSSWATWEYWVARASDPNGLGYNGQGYTGTLINHGTRVSLSQAKTGDLVFYGWENGVPGHVATYVGSGRVVSHGSEIGPLLLPVTYRPIVSIHSYL